MFATLFPTRPANIIACSTVSGNAATRPEYLNKNILPSSSSSTWWAPVFGWSTDPDYIDSNNKNESGSDSGPMVSLKATRAAPGGFTEEKARRLRKMMSETTAFHDVMYHSSIAAKLASDFSSK